MQKSKFHHLCCFHEVSCHYHGQPRAQAHAFSQHKLPSLEIPGNVLVAKYENDRQLVAIERVREGLFSLYRLSNQVKLKDVRKLAAHVKKLPPLLSSQKMNYQDLICLNSSKWWSTLQLDELALNDACLKTRNFCGQQALLSNILKTSKKEEYVLIDYTKFVANITKIIQESYNTISSYPFEYTSARGTTYIIRAFRWKNTKEYSETIL